MTIEVAGLAWAEQVVGVPFPRGDEDALWRCALAWRAAAARLRAVPAQAAEAGVAVAEALEGTTADRFALLWRPLATPDGPFAKLADACDSVAAGFDRAATQVEHAKLAFLAALGILATTMNVLWITLAGRVGPGWLGIPAALARIELALRDVVTRLVLAVAIGANGLPAAVVTLTAEARRDLADMLRHGSIDGPRPAELPAGSMGLPTDMSGGAFDTVPAHLPVGLPDGLAELLLAGVPLPPGTATTPPTTAPPTTAPPTTAPPTTPPSTAPSTGDTAAPTAVVPPIWAAPVVPPAPEPVPASAPRPQASGPAPTPTGPQPSSSAPVPSVPLANAAVPAPAVPTPAVPAPAVPAAPPAPPPSASAPVPTAEPRPIGGSGGQYLTSLPGTTQAGVSVFAVLPGTIAVEATAPSTRSNDRTGVSPASSDVDDELPDLGDEEALALARACMYATEAGYGFHPPDDENRELARAVRPLSGYVTLDVSGDAGGVTLDNRRVTPDQWAWVVGMLVASGELTLRPGDGIRLLASAAASTAQSLADALGVTVLAPDRLLWTDLAGEGVVASADGSSGPVDPPDGTWVCYETRTARYTEVM